MDYRQLLKEFMTTPSVSGYEKAMAYRLKEEFLKSTPDVTIDLAGNVIAKFEGTDPKAPVIMAYAHLDQLGFIVRKIEPDGFIQVDRLGGIPEKVLPGLAVQIMNTDGKMVDGVFGNKAHHAAAPEEKYKVDYVTALFIDVGASNADEVRAAGIDVGCPVIYRPFASDLMGNRVSGTAVDDRGGLVALTVAANKLSQTKIPATVYLVGTVWEEFNLRGAMLAGRTCKPDISLSLDVVLAGDTPDLKNKYEDVLGKGPALIMYSFHGRGTLNGTLPHKGLADMAVRAAKEDGIPLQRFASLGILTDSAYLQLEGMGVAALELGFPARYTHTPIEVCDYTDVVKLGELLFAMVKRIDASFDLHRY